MAERVEHIGDCTLYLGDCLEVMPTLGRFDAVVTDPPYGIGFPYISYDDTEGALKNIISKLMPWALENAKRTIITPGNTNIHSYPKPSWVGAWTWDTTTARGFWGWSQWQPILLYGEDVSRGTASVGGVFKSDRIHFSGGAAGIRKADGGGHTCPKPLEFMRRLVARFTLPGETVLDPFMGSGTTGVACVKQGRKFTGIEMEPTYFDIACKRIEEAYKQPDMFVAPPSKPVQEGFDLG